MTIRVGIVDDHPVVRDGMTALLREYPDLEVVATADTIASGRQLLDGGRADVVLLDLRLGQKSGLALLADPGGAATRPAIVVLTAFDHAEYVAAACRLGAAGFVVKTAPIAQLVDAIRRAAAGATLGATLAAGADAATEPTLTGREQQIVRCMVDGRSNDEIGAALSISRKTVEGHLSRLFARVGVASRAELAARAVVEGWLDVPTIPRRRPRRP
jgi:DNA-binding NarL/FixJ family response regulator